MTKIPEYIRKQFFSSHILEYFESLSPSHQREYLKWIDGAKLDHTKVQRVKKAIEMLESEKIDHTHLVPS